MNATHKTKADTPYPYILSASEYDADKYPDVAIHGYCAGNPIKFTDPSGMRIEIPGGLAQYAVDEIMTAMQILTDDKSVYKTQSDGLESNNGKRLHRAH